MACIGSRMGGRWSGTTLRRCAAWDIENTINGAMRWIGKVSAGRKSAHHAGTLLDSLEKSSFKQQTYI